MGKPLLFVSAGEPSGDNAASHLISCLKEKLPDLTLFGLGGSKLKALGQEQLADTADLAVLGFWEVARRYPFFRGLLNRCTDQIERRRPSCILLVDYPGFNLRLAERIKPLRIPIVYYISPQVWAWGGKRIHQIKRIVDMMILILPFEADLYDRHGVPNATVGHYLLDDIPPAYVGSPLPESNRLALLPGSRPQEVDRMLGPMLETARRLCRERKMTAVVAAVKNGYNYEDRLTEEDAGRTGISFQDSRKIIFDSRVVLTASGTATLETGIIGRPMVVVYKTGWLSYWIARRLVKLEMIALVNLVLGRKVVPELIQSEVTPYRMCQEVERYLVDDDYRESVKSALDRLPECLGGRGASQRAAELVREFL
jgi:lipid-A-disaccharide synthase